MFVFYYRFYRDILTKLSFYIDFANPSVRVVRVQEGLRKEQVALVVAQKLNWDDKKKEWKNLIRFSAPQRRENGGGTMAKRGTKTKGGFMTSEEKAKEIYEKFLYLESDETRWNADSMSIDNSLAKQCAIITVNEIIDEFCNMVGSDIISFWEGVKSELEKL